MKTVVKTYAKINLSLNVYGVNGGYHDIDSVVVSVGLCDTIKLKKTADREVKIKMKGFGTDIPLSENNAKKAAELFIKEFDTGGAEIEIDKKIPIGGGLGGSSADSAGVLRAMAKAYGVKEDLSPLAKKIGSDTAYQLFGGFARLKGRGEVIEELSDISRLYVVLALTEGGVTTKECYALFDNLEKEEYADNDALISDIGEGDVFKIGKNLRNGLLNAALKINPKIEDAYSAIKEIAPAAHSMTGSGATVFALFKDRKSALKALKTLKNKGFEAIMTTTTKRYN